MYMKRLVDDLRKMNALYNPLISITLLLLSIMTTSVSSAESLSPNLSDVTYYTISGVELKLDLYFPKNTGDDRRPLVVYVHGGAWIGGDKREGAGFEDIPGLLSRGYVVAAVNYRLAPMYKFPAQIEDVKCAIRYLRAKAAAYNIDPDRVGAWGGSAGGHLVALLGVTDKSAGFDAGPYLDQSSRVEAVVDYFGPANLTHGWSTDQLIPVFGSRNGLVRGSPVSYITKDDPPFLIMHGEFDTVVPPEQSQEFHDKLKASGVSSTLIMVKNAEHSFRRVGASIKPSRPEITETTAAFFDTHLRGPDLRPRETATSSSFAKNQAGPWQPIVTALVFGALLSSLIIFIVRPRFTTKWKR